MKDKLSKILGIAGILPFVIAFVYGIWAVTTGFTLNFNGTNTFFQDLNDYFMVFGALYWPVFVIAIGCIITAVGISYGDEIKKKCLKKN